MNQQSGNSGNSVNQNVSSGRDATAINGSYQTNTTTTQNFWISMSIIGTISIGTLIGTASLALYMAKSQKQLETRSKPQPTLPAPSQKE